MGDDQRRGSQVVGLHVGADAAFKVTVARQDCRSDDAILVDGIGNVLVQRAGVADTGGAAVTDEVEAELVEILLQAGIGEIFADDLRAGSQRSLDPRLHGQALGDGIAGQQAGADQHARIRGVGAGGDGGDDHIAMADLVVLVRHLVASVDVVGLAVVAGHGVGKAGCHVLQRDAAFGTLGAGHGRHDVAEVQRHGFREYRVRGLGGAEQTLRLGVFLDQGGTRRRTAGGLQIIEALAVDGEEAAGRAIFGSHVADCRAIGEGQRLDAGAVEFDEFADDALLAQHLGDGQHEVGSRDAFLQLAGQLEADDFRQQHGQRLAEHAGLGLDAADAPAQNRQAVDHGGVRVGADQRIRIGDLNRGGLAARRLILLLAGPDGLRQVLEVDLVADAGARRHDAEVVERALAPLQEVVALGIALVLQLHILLEGAGRTEFVNDDRVVDHQIDRHQRIDLFRIAAQLVHGVAHGGQIDDSRNAGEILHQHAGRTEGDFLFLLALVDHPLGASLDIRLGNRTAVLMAQQVFQQNLHGERQLGNILQTILFRLGERKIVIFPGSDRKGLAAFETVERGHLLVPDVDGPSRIQTPVRPHAAR